MPYKKFDPDPSKPIRMDVKATVYVTGHPRSGNTWLNRLLSDILSSPMQAEPGRVVEWFGEKHGHDYMIRKRHVPGWDYAQLLDGRIVFIQRDPRDVAISAMYYRGGTETSDRGLMDTLASMIERKPPKEAGEHYAKMGIYEAWVRSWTDFPMRAHCMTTYEALHKDPIAELMRIMISLIDHVYPVAHLVKCYERQRFDNWQSQYPHSMRKGVAGDWVNYFKRRHGIYLERGMGKLMREQGYTKNDRWWRDLPE